MYASGGQHASGTEMNTLKALQDWYLSQCDESWEHQHGVEIGTLDNPGWSLKIDLKGTNLSDVNFLGYEYGVGDDHHASRNDWLICKIDNDQFVAYGGPEKLDEMICVFLEWTKNGV